MFFGISAEERGKLTMIKRDKENVMQSPSPEFFYLLIALLLICLLCLLVFPTVAVEGGRNRALHSAVSLCAGTSGSSAVLRSHSEQMVKPFSEKFFSYSVITFPSPSGEACRSRVMK